MMGEHMVIGKKSRQQVDAERRQRLSQYSKHPGDPKNARLPKYILGKSASDVKEHFENERNTRRYPKKVYEKLLETIVASDNDKVLKKENVLGETFYYGVT